MNVRLKPYTTLLLVYTLYSTTGCAMKSAQESLKQDFYSMDPEGLKDYWYSMTVKALLKAKARTLFPQLPFSEKIVYEQCELDASTVLDLARCVVALLDERDRLRLQRTEQGWHQWNSEQGRHIPAAPVDQLHPREPAIRGLANGFLPPPISPSIRRTTKEELQDWQSSSRTENEPQSREISNDDQNRIDINPSFLRQTRPISPTLRRVQIMGKWSPSSEAEKDIANDDNPNDSAATPITRIFPMSASKKNENSAYSAGNFEFDTDSSIEVATAEDSAFGVMSSTIPEEIRRAPKKAAIRSHIFRLPVPGVDDVPQQVADVTAVELNADNEIQFKGSYGSDSIVSESKQPTTTSAPVVSNLLPFRNTKIKGPKYPFRTIPPRQSPKSNGLENQARGAPSEIVARPVPLRESDFTDRPLILSYPDRSSIDYPYSRNEQSARPELMERPTDRFIPNHPDDRFFSSVLPENNKYNGLTTRQRLRIATKPMGSTDSFASPIARPKQSPTTSWFPRGYTPKKTKGIIRRLKRSDSRHEILTQPEAQIQEVPIRRKQPPNFSINPSAKFEMLDTAVVLQTDGEAGEVLEPGFGTNSLRKSNGISKRKKADGGLDMQISIKVNPHEEPTPKRLDGVRALIFDRRAQILNKESRQAISPKRNRYGISRIGHPHSGKTSRGKREIQKNVTTRVDIGKGNVSVLADNTTSKLNKISTRLAKIAGDYINRLTSIDGNQTALKELFGKNEAKLAKIKQYFEGVERYNAYVARMNNANTRFFADQKLSMSSQIGQMPDLNSNSFITDMLHLINNFQLDTEKLSIISPRLLSLFPDAKIKKRPQVLSPTLFSFQRDGMLSMPDLFKMVGTSPTDQNFWLDLSMELSGASMVLDDLIASMGAEMDRFAEQELPMLEELETKEKKWKALTASYSDKQREQLNNRGYTFMEPHQAELMYDCGKEEGQLDIDLNHYAMMTDEERDARVELDIRQLAALGKQLAGRPQNGSTISIRHRRRARRQAIPTTTVDNEDVDNEPGIVINGITFRTLAPYAFASAVNEGGALELITLSPHVFINEVIAPEAMDIFTLSPRAFAAAVLSPSALIARTLSPSAFRSEVLSPRAFTALTLTPEALLAEVLSPKVFEPRVLSPEALVVYVLSPTLLSPYIDSQELYGILVLSPHILSPRIRSHEHMVIEVLSPHVLGGEHSHEEASHEVLVIGSHGSEGHGGGGHGGGEHGGGGHGEGHGQSEGHMEGAGDTHSHGHG